MPATGAGELPLVAHIGRSGLQASWSAYWGSAALSGTSPHPREPPSTAKGFHRDIVEMARIIESFHAIGRPFSAPM
jgi:hypothetical protein